MKPVAYPHLELLKNFDLETLPNLDACVLGALELFSKDGIPRPVRSTFRRPLIVGSGNAGAAARILFRNPSSVFADETDFKQVLATDASIDGAILVSASGGKHAIGIARDLQESGMRALLLTHNPDAPASKYVRAEDIYVFPKNREPYTYNASTYLGLVMSVTGEQPDSVLSFIAEEVAPGLPNTFGQFDAFFITVPDRFGRICPMFLTKFDELFGARVSGRAFAVEQAKHAKTVVESPHEFFIHLSEDSSVSGGHDRSIVVPLPTRSNYAAVMAIGYFVIGAIQKEHPPYFKESIAAYCKSATALFGHRISPIVE